MEQRPSWEANGCSPSEEIFRLLWTPKGFSVLARQVRTFLMLFLQGLLGTCPVLNLEDHTMSDVFVCSGSSEASEEHGMPRCT
jgi:hypothetical protein